LVDEEHYILNVVMNNSFKKIDFSNEVMNNMWLFF